MAERWAVAAGNSSTPGTWNGGTLPASGDDLYSNGFIVTIDASLTANSLKNIAGTTAVQGGYFTTAMTGTIALQTLSVGAFTGTLATVGLLNLTGGAVTVTVVNAVVADSSTTGDEPPVIRISGGTHSVTAPSWTGSAGRALSVAAGTLTVGGNVVGGTGSPGMLQSAGTVTINGNVTGGTGVSQHGVALSAAGSLTVNGNVSGASSGDGGVGVSVITGAVLVVNGNVTGGTATGAYGVTNTASTVTVTGNITAGTVDGVRLTTSGTLTARGIFTPTSSGVAINNGGAALAFVRLAGEIRAASGSLGVTGRFMAIQSETLEIQITDDDLFPSSWSGSAVTLTTASGGVTPSRYLNVGGVATAIQ